MANEEPGDAQVPDRGPEVPDVVALVTTERRPIGLELHDSVAQNLVAVIMQLSMADSLLDGHDEARTRVLRAKSLTQETLEEMRRVVARLAPPMLEERPLGRALNEEVRRSGMMGPENVIFRRMGRERPVPPAVRLALLRICQEAIANAQRHAHATQIAVLVKFNPHHVSLQVSDDGSGFDPASAEATKVQDKFGLAGMSERVRAVRGTLVTDSAVGKGTRITAQIPLPSLPEGGIPGES